MGFRSIDIKNSRYYVTNENKIFYRPIDILTQVNVYPFVSSAIGYFPENKRR
jgi:hypothetical protein